jgi:proteic killer suppression protein
LISGIKTPNPPYTYRAFFALSQASYGPEQMNVPGFDFPLRGVKPTRHSVHVNGPLRITFEFEDGDACRVDFEQYH